MTFEDWWNQTDRATRKEMVGYSPQSSYEACWNAARAEIIALRDEWRNEGPDCTHVLCESEHNSGCGASSCFAKDVDERVFGIKYG